MSSHLDMGSHFSSSQFLSLIYASSTRVKYSKTFSDPAFEATLHLQPRKTIVNISGIPKPADRHDPVVFVSGVPDRSYFKFMLCSCRGAHNSGCASDFHRCSDGGAHSNGGRFIDSKNVARCSSDGPGKMDLKFTVSISFLSSMTILILF